MYEGIHTAFDVMKEFLIAGAELDGDFGFPVLEAVNIEPKDTVDFGESFSRKIKNHRELCVNFYIDDSKFGGVWSHPDKYISHLRCFHSVIAPDFSIDTAMPLAMQVWNKYRNHAITYYYALHGLKMIPSVSILNEGNYDWCFQGLPKHSTLAVSTNGRVKSKAGRIEFCHGFEEMARRLEPNRVIVVGHMPPELETDVEIINLQSRNQKINERYGGKNGNSN